jgi:RNA recognition motif-containing protein
MKQRILVGNLPFNVDEEDLQEVFSEFGPVYAAEIVRNRKSGTSRGFGFVELDIENALPALYELNGSLMGGRPIKLDLARTWRYSTVGAIA